METKKRVIKKDVKKDTKIKSDISDLPSTKISEDDLISVIDAEVEKNTLVGHHINSFNNFTATGMSQIITQLFEVNKTSQNERTKTPEDNEIGIININV